MSGPALGNLPSLTVGFKFPNVIPSSAVLGHGSGAEVVLTVGTALLSLP